MIRAALSFFLIAWRTWPYLFMRPRGLVMADIVTKYREHDGPDLGEWSSLVDDHPADLISSDHTILWIAGYITAALAVIGGVLLWVL